MGSKINDVVFMVGQLTRSISTPDDRMLCLFTSVYSVPICMHTFGVIVCVTRQKYRSMTLSVGCA